MPIEGGLTAEQGKKFAADNLASKVLAAMRIAGDAVLAGKIRQAAYQGASEVMLEKIIAASKVPVGDK